MVRSHCATSWETHILISNVLALTLLITPPPQIRIPAIPLLIILDQPSPGEWGGASFLTALSCYHSCLRGGAGPLPTWPWCGARGLGQLLYLPSLPLNAKINTSKSVFDPVLVRLVVFRTLWGPNCSNVKKIMPNENVRALSIIV